MRLEEMRDRLRKIQRIGYSLHFERDVMVERKITKSAIEAHLSNPDSLLATDPQEGEKYRLVFPVSKKSALAVVLRFIGEQEIRIITAHPIALKRLRRYRLWLQK